jgi:hypothetical protein
MWDKVCADINSKLGFKQPAAAWSVLRGLKRNEDHKTHIELITINEWAQYYEKLLNENREEFKDDNEFNHGNLGFEISEEEVKRELAAGKNGKAAGPGSWTRQCPFRNVEIWRK